MNDVTFIEAARVLAERTLAINSTTEERIRAMFFDATSREPRDAEFEVFDALVRDLSQRYEQQPSLASELIKTGEAPIANGIPLTELAVWTAVANVILSLDEAITRP
jgi:hypothetical protein